MAAATRSRRNWARDAAGCVCAASENTTSEAMSARRIGRTHKGVDATALLSPLLLRARIVLQYATERAECLRKLSHPPFIPVDGNRAITFNVIPAPSAPPG